MVLCNTIIFILRIDSFYRYWSPSKETIDSRQSNSPSQLDTIWEHDASFYCDCAILLDWNTARAAAEAPPSASTAPRGGHPAHSHLEITARQVYEWGGGVHSACFFYSSNEMLILELKEQKRNVSLVWIECSQSLKALNPLVKHYMILGKYW